MALRSFGLLEALELRTFDLMLQFRSKEEPDSHLIIIELTKDDFPDQNIKELPAERVIQALKKLQPLNPRIIGLDFNHSYIKYANKTEKTQLANILGISVFQGKPNTISICAHPTATTDGKNLKDGTKPYPSNLISRDRIGFSTFATGRMDDEVVMRRQKLVSDPSTLTPQPPSDDCTVTESFSLLIAHHFLESQGISYTPADLNNLDSPIQFGSISLPRVESNTGGYHDEPIKDYQILLNYRSGAPAKKVSLTEFLQDSRGYAPNIKDNIVLIGLTAKTDQFGDYSLTPYGKLPGVEIHAHMISQLLSAVLSSPPRPLLWALPKEFEFLLILVAAIGGSVVAVIFKQRRLFWRAVIIVLVLHTLICYGVLWVAGLWLPLVPISVGFVLASVWVKFQKQLNSPA